ncbi:hypothetical protein ACIQUS_03745 [Pseudomonas sp. NPDC090755]|uniref:hypothetical protein n=1 Tax=Pseudomonas sp. NPDC090755 TaxID=3364481 RepID=UPI003839D2A0
MSENKTPNEKMLEDIKTIFDGIKCIGLCAAIILGLQLLQGPMISVGFNEVARGMVNFVILAMSGALTIAALYWTACSLKSEPRSKIFHGFSVLILSLIALAAIAATAYSTYQKAPFALLM